VTKSVHREVFFFAASVFNVGGPLGFFWQPVTG